MELPREDSADLKADIKSGPSRAANPTAGVDSRPAPEPPRGQDIPQRPKDAEAADARKPPKGVFCEFCDLPGVDNQKGRNIVVCLDGTANQYGKYNTNVVELFSRVIQDDRQTTYYSSGIGTYARPSWRSFSYYKQVFGHIIDLAIAWKFERVIFEVYEWLVTEYQPGDRIYLFGFSRGAYQVRTLAAMIQQMGLLRPGHKSQIPFAFELYAGLKAGSGHDTTESKEMIERFKKTFSRERVPIHFVGVWDSVSSVGLARDKGMPGTDIFNDHVCYFRHALALDERRVKFLPEYICGGDSDTTERKAKNGVPRVKEVWFAGCHSDIGGGNVSNKELNNAAIPVLWMANEARFAGLRLQRSEVEWKWDQLEKTRPTESLNGIWWLLEVFPITRLSYTGRRDISKWTPHLARGRVVKPGQRIHASVAFIHSDYTPKARLALPDTTITWKDIVGSGKQDDREWIKDILELDLFDIANVSHIIDSIKLNSDFEETTDFIGRLYFLALTREGAEAILALDSALALLSTFLKSKDRVDTASALLQKLISHDTSCRTVMHIELIETLREISESESPLDCRYAVDILRAIAAKSGALLLPTNQPSVPPETTAASEQRDTADIPRHLVLLYLSSIRLARYDRSNKRTDLAAAEGFLQEALAVIPTSNPDWSFVNNGLATIIETRTMADIESAIATRRNAMENADDPSVFKPELARSLINFATSLASRRIRPEDALQATEEAVGLYRELSDKDHSTFDPDLALSLNNHCNRLSDLGRREQAREAIDEAVELYRCLVKDIPSTFTSDLATSLTNQSGCLAALGLLEEALRAAEEAVKLHREVSTARPSLSLHSDLASSLTSLSDRLRSLSRHRDALTVIEEAVRIHRELPQEHPATLDPNLACSLTSLSHCLSALYRRNDALTAIEEAVGLYRRLAMDHPAVFNPVLAEASHTLFSCLSDLGHQDDALAAIEEIVKLYRGLAADHPAAFNPNLAQSLRTHSNCLYTLSRREEALEALEEAVSLYRGLSVGRPDDFNAVLAESLNSLYDRRPTYGRALPAIKEAVKLYRDLAADGPASFNPKLAHSLDTLSDCLSNVGPQEDALATSEEAVKIYRGLAADRPADFNSNLAHALNILSNCLTALGRRDDALLANEEVVGLYRDITTQKSELYKSDLAESLDKLSVRLSAFGRREDALLAIEEAVQLYRGLNTHHHLASSLNKLSLRLSDLGRRDAALVVNEEVVSLYRELAAHRSDLYSSDLAESLNDLSLRLSDLDRREDALVAIEEAVELYRSLIREHSWRQSSFNKSLRHLSYCLSQVGRADDALRVDAELEKLPKW